MLGCRVKADIWLIWFVISHLRYVVIFMAAILPLASCNKWTWQSFNWAVVHDTVCCLNAVLWRCWLDGRNGIQSVKTEWWGASVVICLERGADLHMAQLMPPLSLVSLKSRLVLPFWYRLTWVVPINGPLNVFSTRYCMLTHGINKSASNLGSQHWRCLLERGRHISIDICRPRHG